MAFIGIGAAIAGAIGAGTFVAGAIDFGVTIAASVGISYAAQALAGHPATPASHFSAQIALQADGALPRQFPLGKTCTGGQLLYFNTWGNSGQTPNAYYTRVTKLSDLPLPSLAGVWVNGEKCTLGDDTGTGMGRPVLEYRKSGVDYLWVKFYDGTQTAADDFLVGKVSSEDRPYQSTRIGYGLAYVITTALIEDTLYNGQVPTLKYEVPGIPLYDPSKDSSNGGDGTQRFADRTTWGGDGDDLVAVQAYNVLRGITYSGTWLYGLQKATQGTLPAVNWLAQIAKCRAPIAGADGDEPTYRAGGMVTVDTQPADLLTSLCTAGSAKLCEVGGFYKINCGEPDAPSFAFTDTDIITSQPQTGTPFLTLADSINGITGSYPDPSQGWNTTSAPALYSPDDETTDGNRRLLANPDFGMVYSPSQVQRLMKSALADARRERNHVIVLPPPFWSVEPGDVCTWTSVRNGYASKMFVVTVRTDRADNDVGLALKEVDPGDYDWNHDADYRPGTVGPTVYPRPPAQGISDWNVEGEVQRDSEGLARRPAAHLTWDNGIPGIVGIRWMIRLKSDQSQVTADLFNIPGVPGDLYITQSLLPLTDYEMSVAYIPSAPRDMLWSEWRAFTTPDVRNSLADWDDATAYIVTTALDQLNNTKAQIEQIIASVASNDIARNYLDTNQLRREITSVTGAANARITEVYTVATGTQSALAQTQLDLSTGLADANSRIDVTNTSLTDLSQSVATQTQAFTTQFGSVTSSINTEIGARSAADTALAGQISTLSTTVGGHTSSLSVIASSVNGIGLQFGVTGTIDGTTGGFVFQGVRRLDGTVSYGFFIDGDVIINGTIRAGSFAAGAIRSIDIDSDTIETRHLTINSVGIDALIQGAATQRTVQPVDGTEGGANMGSQTVTILSSKAQCTISTSIAGFTPSGNNPIDCWLYLYVDGVQASPGFHIYASGQSGSWSWTMTGLSAGAHTFDWRAPPSATVGAVINGAGQTVVDDLRR